MTTRQRIASFGSAATLIVAGAVCAAVLGGVGQVLALALIGVGLVLATSLVFLEVGLSEDQEHARAQARTLVSGTRAPAATRATRAGLGRARSHRRRVK
jgi:hypothetical protein